MYKKVNQKQSFPKLEEDILEFWKENEIFEKSMETRSKSEEFNFYDGPPFATGTPHYGHILAGTIKDVIPRYQTMKGKLVKRVFGWDCHGLPIENIVEKKLNISGRDDIENKIGIHDFNESCRENVLTYTDEWEKIVNRTGRWVDMKNAYHTMDKEFMESVWWVFKNIYDKGLVYEGNRVVPYCPRCTTPLSNFEVNQGYKDKQDKAVTVKFKVKGNESKYILAWTTTPWTLYSNLGLAVGKDIMYSEILDKKSGNTYILATERIGNYYKQQKKESGLDTSPDSGYITLKEYPGSCLVGTKYEAIFPDIKTRIEEMGEDLGTGVELGKNAYSVVIGHHVTTESGTGIVHIAPAYGEDDNLIGKNEKLGFITHIGDDGKTCNLLKNNGVFVFDFNEIVLNELKEKEYNFHIGTIDHSYPHCWRCNTPLIYRAISAWYIAVEKIRDKMVVNNQKINWVPEVIKNGRFGKWIDNARDWNISRNRYWGSAIPIWQSEDKKEQVCIGSIQELYELNKDFGQIEKKGGKYYFTNTGKEIDIHKHFVDEIKIKHPKTGTILTRIPEVLDCWFESGSMPYASKHYPFEEEKDFKFPADFIAEGLDQTRGWFYTLLILGTALFDEAPMKNIIVNGIVLAQDGKKMSKSLQNYPDPKHVLDKYGADAMRFYIMNSPVVAAEDFRFTESGVEEVVKKVILPLWNTYSFFTTYANIDKFKTAKGSLYFVRHGETDRNAKGIMNAGDTDTDLNKNGINGAINTGKKAKLDGINFDIIISSPLKRASKTAELIAKEIGYKGDIIYDDRLIEQYAGILKDYSHNDIRKEFGVESLYDIRNIYKSKKYNKKEDISDFITRVSEAFNEIKEKYLGKNVLIVGHSGVFRPINMIINNLSIDDAVYKLNTTPNSTIIKLPNLNLNNPLDKWVLSELHKLIGEVSNGLDNYKLNHATKPIVKFMNNLTNWYIRRSRKRFWKSENDSDKIQAYNTLHTVLLEVSKIIAPFMPFLSEDIYKNLTGLESVHLSIFPKSISSFIFKDLNNDMDKTQKIITLGLSWRANHKIRVRQPLQSITIGEPLSDYYKTIILEELNVKEVIIVDGNTIAKQVCKPNGRSIGPKFGKDVKFIMTQAKLGNFKELDNGNIKILNPSHSVTLQGLPLTSKEEINKEFILEKGDFELVFEAGDNSFDIETDFGMAIIMDPEITEELKLEGLARDIVRQIQEARKEAEYNVEDRIEINIIGNQKIIEKFGDYIEAETLSKIAIDLKSGDLEKEIELEGNNIKIILKK